MNDNQIMQALEICKGDKSCVCCPYYSTTSAKCMSTLQGDALNLIQKQREEINELTGKHWNEAGQIAKYSDELYKARSCLEDVYNIVIEKAAKQTAGGEENE